MSGRGIACSYIPHRKELTRILKPYSAKESAPTDRKEISDIKAALRRFMNTYGAIKTLWNGSDGYSYIHNIKAVYLSLDAQYYQEACQRLIAILYYEDFMDSRVQYAVIQLLRTHLKRSLFKKVYLNGQ